MGTALSALRTKVYTRLGIQSTDVQLPSATLNQLINDAIAEFSSWADWIPYNTASSFTTTAGDNQYTLDLTPSIRKIRSLRIGDDVLEHVPIEHIIAKYADVGEDATAHRGRPTVYSFVGQILLGPVPDDTYTVNIAYNGYPTELSADGDQFEMQSAYDPAIVDLVGLYSLPLLDKTEQEPYWIRRVEARKRSIMDEVAKSLKPSRPSFRGDFYG